MKQDNWPLKKEIRRDVAELLQRIDELLKTDEDKDGLLPFGKCEKCGQYVGQYGVC